MISARFLSQVSSRINQAKAAELGGASTAFGKVNVIFLGDFGQLPPVRATALFAHSVVSKITENTSSTPLGISNLFGAALWRMVNVVVVLRKNWRAASDPKFTNLLARLRIGRAWEGSAPHATDQVGNGQNYKDSDFKVLQGRLIQTMNAQVRAQFKDAPIVVSTKVTRDFINRKLVKEFANQSNKIMHDYCANDRFNKTRVTGETRNRLWQIRSSVSKDAIGLLPLVPGMKVMVTENVAIKAKVVNGQEGTLVEVKYDVDESANRFAKCAYVHIPGSGIHVHGQALDVVPILPVSVSFSYNGFSISRTQLPLLPAYSYTDYKSQGRSLKKVIIDLSTCRSLQSAYVMLSRATSLEAIAVLRQFEPKKIYKRMAQEFRAEFSRLDRIDADTTQRWTESRNTEATAPY
ncbi:P-loop containing nucleoside triphosphate hydrolase protein [Favolaschia claudopus]|uniref:P-loop containing nucleoside triphosphate hydrolase protein n=1 Tax=Favolaschia claudopus TaxID=2862362 RepID=A0AAW0B9C8_9AGAR